MPRYIALLRAINVGGHTVKMDQLRKLFEEMELENVSTFIASGNVIFDSPARSGKTLEKKIEAHLEKALGYEVGTFVRSAAEIAEVAAYEPFPKRDIEADGVSLYIMFLHEAPSKDLEKKLNALPSDVDEFHVHGREIYRLGRAGISGSPLFKGTLLEKTIGVPTTARNANTVRKLAEKFCG